MGWSVPVRGPGLPAGPENGPPSGVERAALASMGWGAGWRTVSTGFLRMVTTGGSPGRRPRLPGVVLTPLRSRSPGGSGGAWRPFPDGGRRLCRRGPPRPGPTTTGPMRPVSVCPAGGARPWPQSRRAPPRPPLPGAPCPRPRSPRSPCPTPPASLAQRGLRGGPCPAPAAAAEPRPAAAVVLRKAARRACRCLRLSGLLRPDGRTFNHEQLGGGGFPDLGRSPAGAP
jgi:hypothetical protein